MMLSLLFEGGADGMEAFVASIFWKMISWLAKQNRDDGVISHVPLWPIFPWYSWTDCSDTEMQFFHWRLNVRHSSSSSGAKVVHIESGNFSICIFTII